MNRKSIIALASCLSVVAVAGVGFSSWLIVNNNASATADGTIVCDTVTDNRVTISTTWVADAQGTAMENNPKIVFGAPKETNIANAWLQTNSTERENLAVYLKIEVGNVNQLPDTAMTYKVDAITSSGTTGDYAKAVSEKYVGALPSGDIKKTQFTVGTDGVGTVVQKIEFSWGSAFKNENPYTYYNSLTVAAQGNNAKEALTNLNTYLTGVSYKVTVSTTSSTTSSSSADSSVTA